MLGYTSREAAGLFGLTPARVRALARAGILSPTRGPRREYRFTFQDLVLLRSARSLVEARVPRRRVHRALRQLVRQLPAGRKLSEVRLTADQGAIVARDGDLVWRPEDGQVMLAFAGGGQTTVASLPARDTTGATAEEWYQHGLDVEPFDQRQAADAYQQALALSPGHVGAHVNLGRVLQQEGEVQQAVHHYQAALAVDPGHATAAFNLGTALEQAGELEGAITAYRRALNLDHRLADAHYNLSLLYQKTGHKLAALVHLRRYRELERP